MGHGIKIVVVEGGETIEYLSNILIRDLNRVGWAKFGIQIGLFDYPVDPI